MKSGLIDTARKEFARLRWSLLSMASLVVLAVLVLGYLLPPRYAADAVLSFSRPAPGAMDEARDALAALAAGRTDGTLRARALGNELLLSFESAAPSLARTALGAVIDAFTADTRESLARALAQEADRLDRELAGARAAHEAAQQELQQALAALPEGGAGAAGARLGHLQAEADALALDIRDGRRRAEELDARVRELDAQIDALRPDASTVQSLESTLQQAQARLAAGLAARSELAASGRSASGELQQAEAAVERAQAEVDQVNAALAAARQTLADERARRAGLVARREGALEETTSLRGATEAKARRANQLNRLIAEARADLERLERQDLAIQRLSGAAKAAEARLREAEEGVAENDEAAVRLRERPELPFTLSVPPGPPRLISGMERWQYVALALGMGLGALLVVLILAALIGRSGKSVARLADQFEVPALVELPIWRDVKVEPSVRRARGAALLLMLLAAGGCVGFLGVL